MENNEIMINEEIEVMNDEFVADGGSDKSTGLTVALTIIGTAAVAAAIGFGKKAWNKYKAKKELRQPDKEIIVDAEKVEEVAEPEA